MPFWTPKNWSLSLTLQVFEWILTGKGILIGDGYVDSLVGLTVFSDYFYSVGLASSNTRKTLRLTEENIRRDFSLNNLEKAQTEASTFTNYYPNDVLGGVNIYNYEEYFLNIPEYYATWLNQDSTKTMMGVPQNLVYADCSPQVFAPMRIDIAQSFKPEFQWLLD